MWDYNFNNTTTISPRGHFVISELSVNPAIHEIILILTHWGRVTHICVSELTIIGSDNGLSPGRRQAIIWNNAGLLLIGPLRTNFSENLIEILTFSFTKMRLKVSSAKWRPFCLGLNVLTHWGRVTYTCVSKLHHNWLRQWLVAWPVPIKPLSEPMLQYC